MFNRVNDGAPGICETKLGTVFATIPNALITTGSDVILRCHVLVTSISKSLYLLSFSKILSDTFVLLGTDISMRKQLLSVWFLTTMSGLSAWIFLSVWMAKSHKKVAFLFAMTFGGLCSHQFLSCGRQKFWHKHQWMYWPNLSCQFWYSAGARMGQPDTRWSMVSMCLSNTLHFGLTPFSNMLAWKFLVGRLWSCTAMMKHSVSDFRSDEDILMGQWRIYIRISSTNWVFTMERLIFPSLF